MLSLVGVTETSINNFKQEQINYLTDLALLTPSDLLELGVESLHKQQQLLQLAAANISSIPVPTKRKRTNAIGALYTATSYTDAD